MVKKIKLLLDEYYDAFTSDNPTPLVTTGNPDLYANRFPGEGRIIYTFYNPTYCTIRVDFPVEKASSYYDLWNRKELKPERKEREVTVPVEVGPRDVGCILVEKVL